MTNSANILIKILKEKGYTQISSGVTVINTSEASRALNADTPGSPQFTVSRATLSRNLNGAKYKPQLKAAIENLPNFGETK